MPAAPRIFAWLAAEAFSDAVRRRIVPAIAALALISLFFIDTCTSCSPSLTSGGEAVTLPQVAGAGGLAMMVLLGLWTAVLAGVLAADHLTEPLNDGSANLLLARPISRVGYALARLAGAWAMAALAGAVVLGATAWLLYVRQGLIAGPAVAATSLILLNGVCVAALAMALSLWLGSTLTSLAVLASVWGLASIEVATQLGSEFSGPIGALAANGPPLAAAPIAALAPWLGPEAPEGVNVALVTARALAWAVASAVLLVAVFRRVELGR
jgi:ABC-type transport system involved in multi-copper enzyme maturation permease subunit